MNFEAEAAAAAAALKPSVAVTVESFMLCCAVNLFRWSENKRWTLLSHFILYIIPFVGSANST